jgi:hypothetical protein
LLKYHPDKVHYIPLRYFPASPKQATLHVHVPFP